MTRKWWVVVGLAGLVATTATAADAAPVGKTLRPVRLVQDLPELGLSAGVTMENDGALVVTATAGDLTVRKQVYADGHFVVRVATLGDDRQRDDQSFLIGARLERRSD